MSLLDNFSKKSNGRPELRELGPFLGGTALAVLLFFGLSVYIGGVSQKDKVLGSAAEAQIALQSAYESFGAADFEKAGLYFENAGEKFEQIDKVLQSVAKTLEPLTTAQVNEGLRLARAGKSISSAGSFFTRGLDSIMSLGQELSKIIVLEKNEAVEPASSDLFKKIKSALADFSWSREFVNIAAAEASGTTLAGDISGKLKELQTGVSVLADFSALLNDLIKSQSTILFIFQNNAEARPGGGFIGSYGRLRLGNEKVESLLIESIYQIDGQLKEKIEPPPPLRFIAGDTWAMRDSNWWPDFKVSAQAVSEFYKKEAGEAPDAVIAFTPDVFEDIAAVLGEVPMPEYGVTLNKNNFYEVLQKQTSEDYDKELNRPKKFMADLADAMLKKLPELSADKKMEVLRAVLMNMYRKNVMFYSRNADAQKKIEAMDLGGNLTDLEKYGGVDGLLISNANVGGGKSDRHIGQKVELVTTIDLGGKVLQELGIERENRVPDGLRHPVNVNYQRIYVPKGSKLISSNREVSVFDELGRTVFATTMTLRPRETTNLKITYELPKNFYSRYSYSLLIEKNPGQKISNFSHKLVLPQGYEIIHNIGDADSGFIDSNKFLGFVFNGR